MADTEADLDKPSASAAPATSQLEDLASRLAVSHFASRRPGIPLLDRVEAQEALLREAYEYHLQESEAQGVLTHAAEWLLDNFYLVQQAARQIGEDMPKGYYRRLPKLDASPLEGCPRIYALAQELVRYGQGRIDLDRVTRFVRTYQRFTRLTMGELWALPTMLRLATLDLLTQAIVQGVGLE
ncbi:MAG: hypothetical protein GWN58_41740, partial [Anaerolineae bacterium]|nr:hypothetical protein [Anaerolineae bacterium]